MKSNFEGERFPKGALYGAAGLVGFAIVAAMAGRMTGVGAVAMPIGTPVESYALRFVDRADGAVVVQDAIADRIVEVLPPGSNGFVRGTLRGLARERKREAIGAEPPFRLTRSTDGRLTLDDPSTGRRVDLDAFGPSNVGAFASIMNAAGAAR